MYLTPPAPLDPGNNCYAPAQPVLPSFLKFAILPFTISEKAVDGWGWGGEAVGRGEGGGGGLQFV